MPPKSGARRIAPLGQIRNRRAAGSHAHPDLLGQGLRKNCIPPFAITQRLNIYAPVVTTSTTTN